MKSTYTFALLFALILAGCPSSGSSDEASNNPPAEGSGEEGAEEGSAETEASAEAPDIDANEENPMETPPDVEGVPDYATVTESGLAYYVLRPGTGGVHPRAEDTVQVHYSGWTTDGELFDSSHRRGQPTQFGLNQVISGWTEGVQLMEEGEKTRFWIPADLAYGENPGGGRPGGLLVFDIELMNIVRPPQTPEDVAGVPDNAETTASGLASRVLEAGDGERNPSPTSTVRVHYSGWTTDGEMFDSSVMRGRPAEFPLNGVIAGWTEGLQLMVEGETRRFWIPAALAYGENPRPGAPAGMLVFDVQLLNILN